MKSSQNFTKWRLFQRCSSNKVEPKNLTLIISKALVNKEYPRMCEDGIGDTVAPKIEVEVSKMKMMEEMFHEMVKRALMDRIKCGKNSKSSSQ